MKRLRIWKYGMELVLYKSDSWPTDESGPGWDRWETVFVSVRRMKKEERLVGEPRAYVWRYDGRPRLVAMAFGLRLCCGFDAEDETHPEAVRD